MVKDVKFILGASEFYPGSAVQGKVMISVDKPKKYHSIIVELWGGANVHWTESSGGEDNSTVTYSNSETYVQIYTVVWKLENSPTGDLPVGEHYFPFSFQLPHNVPPSFFGFHGKIMYELRARIEHSGVINSLVKSDHMLVASLAVIERKPSSVLDYYREPAVLEQSKNLSFLCFKFGSVSATVSIPRTGFSLGDTIPMRVNVNNQSSRRIRVATTLQRIDTFTGFTGRTSRNNVCANTIVRTVSSDIQPRQVASYEDKNLVISSKGFATITNCSCIKVEYVLSIQIVIPWSFNIRLERPIVVCATFPSAGQAIAYPPQQAAMYVPQPSQQAVAYLPPQAAPHPQPQAYLPQPPQQAAVYPQPQPLQQAPPFFPQQPQQPEAYYPQPHPPPQ